MRENDAANDFFNCLVSDLRDDLLCTTEKYCRFVQSSKLSLPEYFALQQSMIVELHTRIIRMFTKILDNRVDLSLLKSSEVKGIINQLIIPEFIELFERSELRERLPSKTYLVSAELAIDHINAEIERQLLKALPKFYLVVDTDYSLLYAELRLAFLKEIGPWIEKLK